MTYASVSPLPAGYWLSVTRWAQIGPDDREAAVELGVDVDADPYRRVGFAAARAVALAITADGDLVVLDAALEAHRADRLDLELHPSPAHLRRHLLELEREPEPLDGPAFRSTVHYFARRLAEEAGE